jgi:dTDP-4-dehydrorhamnose 3,5-epimerase
MFITLKNKSDHPLIHDIIMHPLRVNRDESGILVETLRTDWKDIYGPDREFAMQYFSNTPPGVIRDEDVWHYHPRGQEDRFLVAKGEIVVAVADGRPDSRTKGLLNLFYMKYDEDPYILLIPKRALHGFMAAGKEDAVLLNFPTRLYDPEEEVRIPHTEAAIQNAEGKLFSWEQVKKEFPHL